MFNCDICEKKFESKKSLSNHRRWHDLPEYKDFQENVKKKISRTLKGKKHTLEHRRKNSEAKKDKNNYWYGKYGEENPSWKGDKAGYKAIHKWVGINKCKPENCEICGNPEYYENLGRFELSNITGKLIRDTNNFQWVHRSCHIKYDHMNKK